MRDSVMAPMGALHIQYEIDGHLYTTFVVAVLAGLPVGRALELSWGSQVPDANRQFTAVSAAWNSLWNSHSRSIMRTLHSLHGGNEQAVMKRRHDLKVLVAGSLARKEPDWKVGLMIHAYGDSYAHTYLKHGKEVAYGIPHGHAGDGHTPDKIGEFPEKYLAYVGQLYQDLGGHGDPVQRLDRIHRIVRDHPDSNSGISAGVMAYAGELGMDEQESDRVRDRLLKAISVADVVATMDQMEAAFSHS
jgi:hypothetical protein